jgi:hypothetical protein
MTAAPAMPYNDATRDRAARIVVELAERLADPDTVAAAATAPDNADYFPGMPRPRPPWSGLPLSEGHAAVSLLHSELSAVDVAYRRAAHAHVIAAARYLSDVDGGSLFGGAPALAFAARVAQRHPHDYQSLLDRLDERVEDRLRALLAGEAERLRAGRAGVRMRDYDTIAGAAGLGRYLLLRQPRHRELLTSTLAYLVQLTRPVTAHGHRVPGWWADEAPGLGTGSRFVRGHFNLGLGHGISGPLALLALARQAGIHVPGQDEAIAGIVEHLLPFRFGPGLWRGVLSFDEFVTGSRDPMPDDRMVAWCYGTLGVVRSLYLAGTALDRRDWQHVAVETLRDALTRQPRDLTDCSLCHGWAGLLHITWRMAHDSGDELLTAQLPSISAPILDAYDPALPFGFRYERPGLPPDRRLAPHRAGFLEGAAGIALALHTYATNQEPARSWDAALLIT